MAVAARKTGDPVYDTFIKRSLGTFLPDCIRQLTECRPADPIEFISNSLYKAVDSHVYKKEKEKYLADCLRESELLQQERDARKARLNELLEAEKESKEKLKQARLDEIKALKHLAKNAEKYGIALSPRTAKRLGNLQKESRSDLAAEKPLQIMMPTIKVGADGKPIVVREGDPPPATKVKVGMKGRGKWTEVDEEVTTDSGTVITVKKRKWQPAEDQSSRGSKPSQGRDDEIDPKTGERLRDGMKREYGSVFGDSRWSTGSQKGTVAMTQRGHFTYTGGSMGNVEPPDPLDKQLAPADNPDIWAKERFDCHTLYDHELYIVCDTQLTPPGLDVNQHNSPPRKCVREYLEAVSRGASSEEDVGKTSGTESVERVASRRSSVLMAEGEEYRTDVEEETPRQNETHRSKTRQK